jgi:DNA-binding PadR family transcriptional regulator
VKLTAVTWALLGLLYQRPRSGYDLKQAVDRSIRHFWAASYGQIYPELARLEAAGWIAGESATADGRRRRSYRITEAGRAALLGWLHGVESRHELRDESLLRLFFADVAPVEQGLGLLRARREGYAAMRTYLESLDDGGGVPDTSFTDLVYRWGLDHCAWGEEWCRQQEDRLRSGG